MEFLDVYFDRGKADVPYVNSEDYIQDRLSLLDIYFHILLVLQGEHESSMDNLKMRGMVVTHDEVLRALHISLRSGSYHLSKELRAKIKVCEDYIGGRKALTKNQEILHFDAFAIQFELTRFEQLALLLGLAFKMNRKYEKIFGYLQNDVHMIMPSWGLVCGIYEFIYEEHLDLSDMLGEEHLWFKRMLLLASGHEQDTNFWTESLQIKNSVLEEILGSRKRPFTRLDGADVFDWRGGVKERYIHDKAYEAANHLVSERGIKIHLYGASGSGKRYVILCSAYAHQKNVLFIEASHLEKLTVEGGKTDLLKQYIEELMLELRWNDAWLCICNMDEKCKENTRILKIIESAIESKDVFFITSTQEKIFDDWHLRTVAEIHLPFPEFSERHIFWQAFSESYALDMNVDLNQNANKYLLTPKQIQRVLENAHVQSVALGHSKIGREDIIRAISKENVDELTAFSTRIDTVYTWEDLMLEDKTRMMLEEICHRIKYQNTVWEQWGFYQKKAYGRGLSSLFYGPPGTGKTMAAQVIAKELGLDLYRINAARLISKYIGETEKNMSALFEKAKHMNAVLFFDEADAIFSKRLQGSDVNTKYANMESGHLLQLIEDYEGIVILATNLMEQIDEAFKRRLQFMVAFKQPDEKTRLALWKSMLPEEAVCDEPLDFKLYARKFELSGSDIKDIMIHAAFKAAADEEGIKNRHIIHAIIENYEKYGKIVDISEVRYLM